MIRKWRPALLPDIRYFVYGTKLLCAACHMLFPKPTEVASQIHRNSKNKHDVRKARFYQDKGPLLALLVLLLLLMLLVLWGTG